MKVEDLFQMRHSCGLLSLICYLVAWTASLGHVHLDALAHAPQKALDSQKSIEPAPGHHRCHRHHHASSQEESSPEPAAPHQHHDGENCQLCHHLAHAAMANTTLELVSLDAPLVVVTERSAEIYACFTARFPAPRGPPALMFV